MHSSWNDNINWAVSIVIAQFIFFYRDYILFHNVQSDKN